MENIQEQEKLVAELTEKLGKESYDLGYAYYCGEGVEVNYRKALEYFEKAANLGEAKAQFATGYMYHLGQHAIEGNLEKAVKWYQLAARQGNADAKYILGSMGLSEEQEKAMSPLKK